ncbi:MAG: polysulfide reductase NrfD [Gemmatimonadetes bacterium]|nr:polysulfide reductase NrfD [Gemmatimonadota bacterium]
MPDTFFTGPPHWGWYIVAYFFIGGIAGGAFVISSLLALFGRTEDRPVVHLGYYVACVGALASGVLLTVDLTRPDRFWHMLVQSNTGVPMLKLWSPMSVGAWGVLGFGVFATLAAAGALAESGRPRFATFAPLARGTPRVLVAGAGSVLGFFLAGYTGVLLSVTNRPVWADSNLVGLLFLLSAASSGAAALMLLGDWIGGVHAASRHWLAQFDRSALVLELVTLIVFVVSLGPVARVFLSGWGALLLFGVFGAGIAAPLVWEARTEAAPGVRTAALVLSGSLILRVVIVFSSQQTYVAGAGVVTP